MNKCAYKHTFFPFLVIFQSGIFLLTQLYTPKFHMGICLLLLDSSRHSMLSIIHANMKNPGSAVPLSLTLSPSLSLPLTTCKDDVISKKCKIKNFI